MREMIVRERARGPGREREWEEEGRKEEIKAGRKEGKRTRGGGVKAKKRHVCEKGERESSAGGEGNQEEVEKSEGTWWQTLLRVKHVPSSMDGWEGG